MPISRYGRVIALMVLLARMAISPEASAQTDKPPEVASRGQREAKDITYGDWQRFCFKAGGAPLLCRTSITGRFPTGQMAVRLDLIERENDPAVRLQLFVPVGMYLQQAARLTVDQSVPFTLPYTWCLSNACIAADVAAPATVKALAAGKLLTLEVVDSNLLVLSTAIPLAQFAGIHDGPPAKTLEQYIDE